MVISVGHLTVRKPYFYFYFFFFFFLGGGGQIDINNNKLLSLFMTHNKKEHNVSKAKNEAENPSMIQRWE